MTQSEKHMELLELSDDGLGNKNILVFRNEIFGHGGFSVERCPKPEELARYIYEAVNSHEKLKEENERYKAALEVLANRDADDGAGNIMTPEFDRMGWPVIMRAHEIAEQALQPTDREGV